MLRGGTWRGRRPSGSGGGKRSFQGVSPSDSIFCSTLMVLNPLQNYRSSLGFCFRCGFTELEINLFLAKYEVSENRIMTEEDMQQIMQNFKAKGTISGSS